MYISPPFSCLEASDVAKASQEGIIYVSFSPSQIQRRFCAKTGEVLTPRSSKTRAKNEAKNTKEFCQIKSLITSLGASIDSQNCH